MSHEVPTRPCSCEREDERGYRACCYCGNLIYLTGACSLCRHRPRAPVPEEKGWVLDGGQQDRWAGKAGKAVAK